VLQILGASVLPAACFYLVFRLDVAALGPQAYATWAGAVAVGLLGVVAHGTGARALTSAHLAAGALVGAALGAYATAWAFVYHLQCGMEATAFAPGAAPSVAACDAANKTLASWLLALTGLATVLSFLPALALDVGVLRASTARRAAFAARRQAIRVAVDAQTRLVAAGDRPTVTPGTLCEWVAALLASGDAVAAVAGERCRLALRDRGYEMPLRRGGERRKSRASGGGGGGGGGGRTDIMAYAGLGPASPGGGSPPGGGALGAGGDDADAAERGRARVKPHQITPEPSQRG
jgi:hypothetical protein